jgi:hypothetical protein
VSYYAASESSEGSVRAYLHGNSDFRDPNDCSTADLYRGKAVAQFSRTTTSASTPTWVQQRVPFVYEGTSSVNYVLMSMTTNTTAGGGSANDSLSVDDIEFIYSAWLDGLSVNGSLVANFQRDNFSYDCELPNHAALQSATVSFVTQASDATVTVDTIVPDDLTRQFVLHVLAEDAITNRTYTLTLTCPQSGDTIVALPTRLGNIAFRLYPNPARNQVHFTMQGSYSTGLLSIYDAMGREALSQSLNAASHNIDIRPLPQGLYTVVVRTDSGTSVQRLSVLK